MTLPKYSIAIRTLGTAGEKFRTELESICRQTIQPEKVIVFVADTCGVKYVDQSIGIEEFRYVTKGMIAQRALAYEEIETEYLLLLDDDVELAPDSVEQMLMAAVVHNADAVGADVFRNQEMSWLQRAYAVATNWVRPHYDKRWAYKVKCSGEFAYLMDECLCQSLKTGPCLPTQKLDGPCTMWKKQTIQKLHWEDEIWMDRLSSFAYGDDQVESYKAYVNGYHLFLLYNAGVNYLNAKTASSEYHHTHKKFYIRSMMSALIWYRTIFQVNPQRMSYVAAYGIKVLWLLLVNIIAGIMKLDLKIPFYYVGGLCKAWQFVRSEEYRNMPNYLMKD